MHLFQSQPELVALENISEAFFVSAPILIEVNGSIVTSLQDGPAYIVLELTEDIKRMVVVLGEYFVNSIFSKPIVS